MRILILEDEPEIRDIYRELFQLEGHSVQVGENGADGLATLDKFQLDLVLCDIQMPVLDGISFLRIARPRYPTLAIIMISAGSSYATSEMMAVGASAVLEKSDFGVEKILKLMDNWKRLESSSLKATAT